MKIKTGAFALAGAVLLGCAANANAALVYDNGPIDGNTDNWPISFGESVSDSFTIAGPTTLVSAQVGLWVAPGEVPSTVDWSIGFGPFGFLVGSGTGAAFSNTYQFTNNFEATHFDIYESTFPISGTLGAGTYWLTLQNGLSSQGHTLWWDENSGPSAAQDFGGGPINSESFQLIDDTIAVPEPASLGALGMGAIFLLMAGRRKRAAGH